jgi:hypothetical protein
MGKPLGMSWVAMQAVAPSTSVHRTVLVDPDTRITGPQAIQLLFERLRPVLELADLGEARLGRIVSSNGVSEAGMFFDLSPTEGAALAVKCNQHLPSDLTLTVGRSSAVLRGFMWTVLGVGVGAGLVLANLFSPRDWGGELRFGGGLAMGLALAMPILAVGGRAKRLAGGRSDELAARLHDCVERWVSNCGQPPRLRPPLATAS